MTGFEGKSIEIATYLSGDTLTAYKEVIAGFEKETGVEVVLDEYGNDYELSLIHIFLGAGALAAVGSAYALMTFLTSVLLGLCMGSGAVFSICWGGKNTEKLKSAIFTSFVLTAVLTVILNAAVFLFIDEILSLLNVPSEIYQLMRDYVQVIFWGIGFVFLYNFFAALLRPVSYTHLNYSAPEVLKQLRDGKNFLIFTNIGEQKLCDVAYSVSKEYAKPLEAGEAYHFSGSTVCKIKTVLMESEAQNGE